MAGEIESKVFATPKKDLSSGPRIHIKQLGSVNLQSQHERDETNGSLAQQLSPLGSCRTMKASGNKVDNAERMLLKTDL